MAAMGYALGRVTGASLRQLAPRARTSPQFGDAPAPLPLRHPHHRVQRRPVRREPLLPRQLVEEQHSRNRHLCVGRAAGRWNPKSAWERSKVGLGAK